MGLTGAGREESRKSIDLGQPDLPQDDIIDEVSGITGIFSFPEGVSLFACVCVFSVNNLQQQQVVLSFFNFCNQIWAEIVSVLGLLTANLKFKKKKKRFATFFFFRLFQRVISKDGTILSKAPSGMQSGGEEEQDEEAHTPLPPPMEIIKDPSAQDEKVGRGR